MKLVAGIIVLVTALIISGVAEFFSIMGLMALFPGGGALIVLMGVALGIGKLVAAAWAKAYWKSPNFNPMMRIYMVTATGLLMLITSFGIYGFLAAGHLAQQGPIAQSTLAVGSIQTKLAAKQAQSARLNSRMTMLDKNTDAFLSTGNADKGLYGLQKLKKDRAAIDLAIKENDAAIDELNNQLLPLQNKSIQVSAKLGTIQYVADLFGQKDPEVAVRVMISMITAVFDPLALVLMLSALITLTENYRERSEPRIRKVSSKPYVLPSEPEPTWKYSVTSEPVLVEVPEEKKDIPQIEPIPNMNENVDEIQQDAPEQTKRELLIDLLANDPDFVNELVEIIGEYNKTPPKNPLIHEEKDISEGKTASWLPNPQ